MLKDNLDKSKPTKSVKNLRIYQKSLDLTADIYKLIRENFALSKDLSLCDQLKRSSASVVANIAEGYFRTKGQFRNYLRISSGSVNEIIAFLEIINLVYKIDTRKIQEDYLILGKQINSLSRSLLRTDSKPIPISN